MSFLILVGNYEKNLFRKVNRISYTGNMMAPKNANIGRFFAILQKGHLVENLLLLYSERGNCISTKTTFGTSDAVYIH
jgi:hypothetical protein